MGQAKQRGTYEQRLAQAEARNELLRLERENRRAKAQEAELKRVAAMPPEQREQHKARRLSSLTVAATTVGLIGALESRWRRW